jgi:hypothetical protein
VSIVVTLLTRRFTRLGHVMSVPTCEYSTFFSYELRPMLPRELVLFEFGQSS